MSFHHGPLRLALALCVLWSPAESALGQARIETDLQRLTAVNARRYVRPLARGLAFAMGGGLFDGAAPLGALDFELRARVSAALPPGEAETFDAVLPETVRWRGSTFQNPYRVPDATNGTPTVVGEGPGIVLEPGGAFRDALRVAGENPSDFALPLPRGRKIWGVPSTVLHLSLGIGAGTELSMRFLPELELDEEIGGLSGFGFGVRHALSRWFASPMDLSVVLGRQSIDVGRYLEASLLQHGLMAGHNLGRSRCSLPGC